MFDETILVAGAGGFIGGHLVAELLARGYSDVRAVDVKPLDEWHQVFDPADNMTADLKEIRQCREVCLGASRVYNLADDSGGASFSQANKGLGMLSVLMNTHMLMAAEAAGVERYFFASSAAVYNTSGSGSDPAVPLAERHAYPAMPEDGRGWEKLFSERMCRHFREDFGVPTRVARLHGVYGPHGPWHRGRERAPVAICRKVIHALETGEREIEIWGDGQQTRSFMYIDDCVRGICDVADSDIVEPINLGSSEQVTIDQLVDVVEEIAGVRLKRRYRLDAPTGVRGRNCDNAKFRHELGWEPSIRLCDGLAKTYAWIHDEYWADRATRRRAPASAHRWAQARPRLVSVASAPDV